MEYDKINNYFKQFIKVVNPDYFDKIHKLMKDIFENSNDIPEDYPKNAYSSIDINDSIEIVANFFKTINPMYEQMFRTLIKDSSTTFISAEQAKMMEEELMDIDSGIEITDDSIETYICYNNTFEDVYTLVHEFCHRFSITKDRINFNIVQGIFSETDAIVFELLLQDYLDKKFGNSIKANYKLNTRLINTKECCQFYLEFQKNTFPQLSNYYIMEDLFELYKKYNNINEEIFKNYYDSLKDNSNTKASWDYYDKKEISKHLLQGFLPYGSAHFIGTLLAFYIHQKIKETPSNIEMLTILFNIIGYAEFEQKEALNKLEQIGIPIVTDGKIVIDENSIKKLIIAYQKELEDIDLTHSKNK